ncbi:hypothetical protein ENTCAN_08258 [Enterobacter cancerogenus ATCC 35316]|nr:hypothetical protein ENTCAN_08258 [Enterobacter cancerogenus ATCC 35316]
MLKRRKICVILLQLNRSNSRRRSKKGEGQGASRVILRLFFRGMPQKID